MKRESEKSLIIIDSNKQSWLSIKDFFRRAREFFSKKNVEKEIKDNNQEKDFIERIRVEESDEAKLFNLQRKYQNAEIREENLTEEQINNLINLYDKQIAEQEQKNENKRQKIAKLKNLM